MLLLIIIINKGKYYIKINNINSIKNSEDKNELPNNEIIKTFWDYIYYKENQIGSRIFSVNLYGIYKNKTLEEDVKIINSDTSSKTINKEASFIKN